MLDYATADLLPLASLSSSLASQLEYIGNDVVKQSLGTWDFYAVDGATPYGLEDVD